MDNLQFNNQAPSTTVQEGPQSSPTKPVRPRRKFKHQSVSTLDDNKSDSGADNEEDLSMSDSEELELDPLVAGIDIDEERGLTAKERRKYAARKIQFTGLDARIAGSLGGGGVVISKLEAKKADKYVVKKLVINAVLIALWYFFSLSISIYNKWMFTPGQLNFPFPLFTTSLHMIVQFCLASAIIYFVPSLRPFAPQPTLGNQSAKSPKTTITPMFYITRLIPTGASTSLDIGLGNTSLRFITLTFYTMCKSSVLIFVLTFAFLFRLEQASIKLMLIIFFMTGGVLMMVAGETAFNALGCFLALTASFFSGLRWALTQILLLRHSATHNPFATMFLLTPIMFITLFVLALVSERPAEVIEGIRLLAEHRGIGGCILILIVPGFLAFCMIAAEYTLLQRTNVVTLSICGIFKEVVTIGAAELIFDDKLTAINIGGLLITIVCIACYNYLKVTKMRQEARDKLKKGDVEVAHENGFFTRAQNQNGLPDPINGDDERDEHGVFHGEDSDEYDYEHDYDHDRVERMGGHRRVSRPERISSLVNGNGNGSGGSSQIPRN